MTIRQPAKVKCCRCRNIHFENERLDKRDLRLGTDAGEACNGERDRGDDGPVVLVVVIELVQRHSHQVAVLGNGKSLPATPRAMPQHTRKETKAGQNGISTPPPCLSAQPGADPT